MGPNLASARRPEDNARKTRKAASRGGLSRVLQ